jgi:hypothetical protein
MSEEESSQIPNTLLSMDILRIFKRFLSIFFGVCVN